MRFTRSGLVLACAAVVLSVEGGCRVRRLGGLSTARPGGGGSQREQGPQYTIGELPNEARPILDEDREWMPRIRERYAEAIGQSQGVESIDRLIEAWKADGAWEKPKPERMTSTLATMYADLAGKSLGLSWVTFNERRAEPVLILASADRQVLVFVDNYMGDWIDGSKKGYSTADLTRRVKEAFRPSSPRPAFIGVEVVTEREAR